MIDLNLVNELDLNKFASSVINNIENCQYLNLIYDPLLDRICERHEYEKTYDLIVWHCAICGEKIYTSLRRSDIENFVCEKCRETYNNKNNVVDRRILNSRTFALCFFLLDLRLKINGLSR
jgi:hypothetical protein